MLIKSVCWGRTLALPGDPLVGPGQPGVLFLPSGRLIRGRVCDSRSRPGRPISPSILLGKPPPAIAWEKPMAALARRVLAQRPGARAQRPARSLGTRPTQRNPGPANNVLAVWRVSVLGRTVMRSDLQGLAGRDVLVPGWLTASSRHWCATLRLLKDEETSSVCRSGQRRTERADHDDGRDEA